jgi:hypothetical protein
MAIIIGTILTWSRVANNRRAAVTAELMPGGLDDLKDYTVEDVKEAIKGFKNLPREADRFSISAHSTKRMVQLTLWVKDQIRLVQPAEFRNGTTQAQFVSAIEEAQQREQIREDRKRSQKVSPP